MPTHDISQTLRLGAPPSRAAGALILIHGRGASAHSILPLAGEIATPALAVAAPQADQGIWYPYRFLHPLEQNEPWLTDALTLVGNLVGEYRRAGISTERIAIVGFSQGGCVALEYAARHPARYGLVAGLSGALIGPLDTKHKPADLRQTPVLIGCSEQDSHVPLEYVDKSAQFLKASNAALTTQIVPGHDHTIFDEEIVWLKNHIASMLAS